MSPTRTTVFSVEETSTEAMANPQDEQRSAVASKLNRSRFNEKSPPSEETGEQQRPLVVLLHGLGVDHRMWSLQAGALQELGPVWAPDLPGFGASPPLSRGHRTPESLADWVAERLRRRECGPAHVAGYSMGGTLALLLALRHPELVATLSLCCCSAFWGAGWRKAAASACAGIGGRVWAEVIRRSILWAFARNSRNESYRAELEDMVSRSDPATLLDLYRSLARLDLRGALGGIQVPALVVAGSRDRLAPPSHGRLLAGQLSGAELRMVDGADHVLCLSHASKFSAILVDFLSGHTWARHPTPGSEVSL
jgi:pimeloyl-ACP methyl ester carboxylesterase